MNTRKASYDICLAIYLVLQRLNNLFLEDSTQMCVILSSNKPCLLAEYLKNMHIYNNMTIIF